MVSHLLIGLFVEIIFQLNYLCFFCADIFVKFIFYLQLIWEFFGLCFCTIFTVLKFFFKDLYIFLVFLQTLSVFDSIKFEFLNLLIETLLVVFQIGDGSVGSSQLILQISLHVLEISLFIFEITLFFSKFLLFELEFHFIFAKFKFKFVDSISQLIRFDFLFFKEFR